MSNTTVAMESNIENSAESAFRKINRSKKRGTGFHLNADEVAQMEVDVIGQIAVITMKL